MDIIGKLKSLHCHNEKWSRISTQRREKEMYFIWKGNSWHGTLPIRTTIKKDIVDMNATTSPRKSHRHT